MQWILADLLHLFKWKASERNSFAKFLFCSKAPEKRLMFQSILHRRCTLWESERPFRQTGVGLES